MERNGWMDGQTNRYMVYHPVFVIILISLAGKSTVLIPTYTYTLHTIVVIIFSVIVVVVVAVSSCSPLPCLCFMRFIPILRWRDGMRGRDRGRKRNIPCVCK
jgi:hypothetical protein